MKAIKKIKARRVVIDSIPALGFNFENAYTEFRNARKLDILDYLKFFAENNYKVNHTVLQKLRRDLDIEHIKILSQWHNFVIFINNVDTTPYPLMFIDEINNLKQQIKIHSRKEKIKQFKK
jgi:hypothetical protein